MAEKRTPRDVVSREKKMRAVYTPPSTLPTPNPEPGVSYRWVATAVMGKDDPTNASLRRREGWEPVKATDHPELHLQGDASGNVEVGGLMLCRIPTEVLEAREEYFRNITRNQMTAVDNAFMQQNDPRMPLFSEKKSDVKRGFGSGE